MASKPHKGEEVESAEDKRNRWEKEEKEYEKNEREAEQEEIRLQRQLEDDRWVMEQEFREKYKGLDERKVHP